MIKKAILATVAVAGLCGVGAVLLRPDWLPKFGTTNAVRKRAEGYWSARVAGDQKLMAPYAHPLQAALQENTMLVTDEYEIGDVVVNGDNATVSVKAKYHLKMSQMNAINREVESKDSWVRYQGQWYKALHPVGFGEVLAQGLGKWKPPTAPAAQAPARTAPTSSAPTSGSATSSSATSSSAVSGSSPALQQ